MSGLPTLAREENLQRSHSLSLKKFCFCISVKVGTYVITVKALVFGLLLFISTDHCYTALLPAVIRSFFNIFWILYIIWFLTLLLMLSLPQKLPKKLTIWVGRALFVGLVFNSLIFITVISYMEDLEKNLETLLPAFLCFFGTGSVCYSLWFLRSYYNILLAEANCPPTSNVRNSTDMHTRVSALNTVPSQTLSYSFNSPFNYLKTKMKAKKSPEQILPGSIIFVEVPEEELQTKIKNRFSLKRNQGPTKLKDNGLSTNTKHEKEVIEIRILPLSSFRRSTSASPSFTTLQDGSSSDRGTTSRTRHTKTPDDSTSITAQNSSENISNKTNLSTETSSSKNKGK